jgi:hypothetical protein
MASIMTEGCHRVRRRRRLYAGGVDLRAWIAAEHDGLQDRFVHAVAAHVPPARWRERAGDGGSSIAWLLLHTAWHEDLAMQAAVLGVEPLLATWRADVGLAAVAPAGGLGETEDAAITAAADLDALAAYAAAVHEATGRWLATADLADLPDVPPAGPRIAALAGVTADAVPWLHSMWAGKPAGWFVQWEAIGHRQGHLGEMVSVRSRLGLSPF